MKRASSRIWRGSYKSHDWKHLGKGAWEPKRRPAGGKSGGAQAQAQARSKKGGGGGGGGSGARSGRQQQQQQRRRGRKGSRESVCSGRQDHHMPKAYPLGAVGHGSSREKGHCEAVVKRVLLRFGVQGVPVLPCAWEGRDGRSTRRRD